MHNSSGQLNCRKNESHQSNLAVYTPNELQQECLAVKDWYPGKPTLGCSLYNSHSISIIQAGVDVQPCLPVDLRIATHRQLSRHCASGRGLVCKAVCEGRAWQANVSCYVAVVAREGSLCVQERTTAAVPMPDYSVCRPTLMY